MIHFVTGKPGGGKSYFAVRQICHELIHGRRHIVTNVSLDLGAVAEWCHENSPEPVDVQSRVRLLTESETRRFWLFEGPGREHLKVRSVEWGNRRQDFPDFSDRSGLGTLYVIDEVHIHFSARSWQETGADCMHYLSQHRKLGDDVMLISQHCEQVDKAFRRLAQDFTTVRNMSNERVLGFNLGKRFRRATYLQPKSAGDHQPAQETGWFKLDVSGYGKLYDTSAGVGIVGRTDHKESKGTGRSLLWLIPMIGALAVGIWAFPRAVQGVTGAATKGLLSAGDAGAAGIKQTVGMNGKEHDEQKPLGEVVGTVGQETSTSSIALAAQTNPPVYCVGIFALGASGRVMLSDGRVVSTTSGRVTYLGPEGATVDGVYYTFGPLVRGREETGGMVEIPPVKPIVVASPRRRSVDRGLIATAGPEYPQ